MGLANNFLVVAFFFLALAFSFATAYDPAPLQDFCVAINDTNLREWKILQGSNQGHANDFFFSGINVPRDTSNQLGVNVTLLNVDMIAGLNTNGLSLARIDYAENGGLNPPHHHPRAAEILTVLEGTLYAGFVTANPDHLLFSKILQAGDVFVFPFGLIHFQLNIGETPAVAIAALGSQNPGVITEGNALFGSKPSINPDVLTKAFHLKKDLVVNLQNQNWVNPA
ncbi:hypothetical protein GH714_000698 [Hevea brasiliensis]|uniref:Germin-like protein n=1 Tax=Hevea brasiliensis TaxID=3981 RepID=A0A6A6KHT9_HEVBR|nr:hypothetical protein GH714_000698 [Hevea brasiliensis]